jgi:translocating chain-associated membrane protein 1
MGLGFRKRTGNNKIVPYLSHEFIIQNHGDIATCACMVFIIGLMFQISTPFASTFIVPKHNLTEMNATAPPTSTLYTTGFKDLCLMLFYTIVAVIFHAIIQEYVLDKLMRKIRLSKTKANKFNESGQLLSFYVASIIASIYIFRDDGYFHSLSFFWTGYPHTDLTFLTKMFFIFQISYWLHTFPELYFQKVKKEDRPSKINFATLNLIICSAIYTLNLTRIGLTLLVIDYSVNTLFHLSRILYFFSKDRVSKISFRFYNVFFIVARLAEIVLSIFVFWFGLSASSIDSINMETGNFNTPMVRMSCLVAILALQALMMWNFVLFQLKKQRENKPKAKATTTMRKTRSATKGEMSESESAIDSDLDNSKLKSQ